MPCFPKILLFVCFLNVKLYITVGIGGMIRLINKVKVISETGRRTVNCWLIIGKAPHNVPVDYLKNINKIHMQPVFSLLEEQKII